MNRFARTCLSASRRRPRVVVGVLVVALAVLVAGWWASSSPSSASVGPTAQGKVLVQRFFTLLHNRDTKGLNALLAPSFQVVRANGGVQDKASYLADPPRIAVFAISKLKGSQAGGVLVVSYQVAVAETVAGIKQPTTWAPRLSVFQQQKGAWHLVAHANFGAIKK